MCDKEGKAVSIPHFFYHTSSWSGHGLVGWLFGCVAVCCSMKCIGSVYILFL